MNSTALRTSSEPATQRVLGGDRLVSNQGFSSQDVELMLQVQGQEVWFGVGVGGRILFPCGGGASLPLP